jgi:hypothetical protein
VTVGPDWVAASVRARAIAERRVGAGRCERVGNAATLRGALDQLAGTVYGGRLADAATLVECQAAVNATVLWQLRVLAGWMPATGATLARTVAAGFERINIVAHAERLRGIETEAPAFDLGTLSTAWTAVRSTSSMSQLAQALRTSGWGDPGAPEDPGSLSDVLAVLWLRRLVTASPAVRSWAAAACALLAARISTVDHSVPADRLVALARPLIGSEWPGTRELADFVAALPRSVRPTLEGVDTIADLWRAEARLGTVIEDDGLRLLRGSLPGPDIVLGALAVLAVDAWRLRAALAAANRASGQSATGLEVAHVMA